MRERPTVARNAASILRIAANVANLPELLGAGRNPLMQRRPATLPFLGPFRVQLSATIATDY